MTADEAIERVTQRVDDASGWSSTAAIPLDDLRALLAEIERLRASESGKRRVRAFAAQYQGGDLAHGTVADTERGTWERLEAPWFGAGREQFESEGWRVVPVEIVWSEEDNDADE